MSSEATVKKNKHNGKVFFVSAGPGDADLITVKGAALLAQAEIIIADRLVADEIIHRYASPDAIIVDVGKQGGNRKSYLQKDINDLLVQFSNLYEKVVRLKGGDAAFFSNIYDELQTLCSHDIQYEIVPGVTAASGASAFTGVPLTARSYATGVQFLTFYKHTIISDEKWKQLAAGDDTLVFYMSCNNLPAIVANLLKAGAGNTLPFLVIEQATTPKQRVHTFTLQSFTQTTHHSFASPSIIIMGEVTELYKRFAWFQNHEMSSAYFRNVEDENVWLKVKLLAEQQNTEHVN